MERIVSNRKFGENIYKYSKVFKFIRDRYC